MVGNANLALVFGRGTSSTINSFPDPRAGRIQLKDCSTKPIQIDRTKLPWTSNMRWWWLERRHHAVWQLTIPYNLYGIGEQLLGNSFRQALPSGRNLTINISGLFGSTYIPGLWKWLWVGVIIYLTFYISVRRAGFQPAKASVFMKCQVSPSTPKAKA